MLYVPVRDPLARQSSDIRYVTIQRRKYVDIVLEDYFALTTGSLAQKVAESTEQNEGAGIYMSSYSGVL